MQQHFVLKNKIQVLVTGNGKVFPLCIAHIFIILGTRELSDSVPGRLGRRTYYVGGWSVAVYTANV
jgi:hypothetical protein